jgi:hypothetical protein
MLLRKSLPMVLLSFGLLLSSCCVTGAQVLWNMSLDSPDPIVAAGTTGMIVFTGAIQNTDASQTLTLSGDAFSTGLWDSTLTLAEDPAFIAFLNGPRTIAAGMSYTGALFDLNYSASTPSAILPPYDGSFRVDTDGSPNSLAAPFTLKVTPQANPEPGNLTLLAGLSLSVSTILSRYRRH